MSDLKFFALAASIKHAILKADIHLMVRSKQTGHFRLELVVRAFNKTQCVLKFDLSGDLNLSYGYYTHKTTNFFFIDHDKIYSFY